MFIFNLLCISIIIYSIYMLYRNNKVYTYRLYYLNKDIEYYYNLPDYDYMMYHWNYKLEIPKDE